MQLLYIQILKRNFDIIPQRSIIKEDQQCSVCLILNLIQSCLNLYEYLLLFCRTKIFRVTGFNASLKLTKRSCLPWYKTVDKNFSIYNLMYGKCLKYGRFWITSYIDLGTLVHIWKCWTSKGIRKAEYFTSSCTANILLQEFGMNQHHRSDSNMQYFTIQNHIVNIKIIQWRFGILCTNIWKSSIQKLLSNSWHFSSMYKKGLIRWMIKCQ